MRIPHFIEIGYQLFDIFYAKMVSADLFNNLWFIGHYLAHNINKILVGKVLHGSRAAAIVIA
jgi:hypothetical protein